METTVIDNRLALMLVELIRSHMESLKKEYNVASLALFGSYVRGEQTPESDVDILVEFSAPVGFFKFLDLEERLSSILGREVDLVSKNGLKPMIRESVLNSLFYV